MRKPDDPNVRSGVWRYVLEEAFREQDKSAELISNKDLAVYVDPLMRVAFPDEKADGYIYPALGTIINKIRKARKSWSSVADQPFSLGDAALHGISDEAIPDVLAVWGYCKIIGTKFTARQAKWVARLRKAITLNGVPWSAGNALSSARRYAAREVAVASTRKPDDPLGTDTSALDAGLLFDDGITKLLAEVDRIPKLDIWVSIANLGVSRQSFKDIPSEEHAGRLGSDILALWKYEVSFVVDCLRSGLNGSFGAYLGDGDTDAYALPNEIREIFNSDYDSEYLAWVKKSYFDNCTHVWAIWASYFIDKNDRWAALDSFKSNELEFSALCISLAKEVRGYVRGYVPKEPTGRIATIVLYETFKPSSSLMERAGLEGED